MSEEKNTPVTAQEEMLRRLKAIGADLWGGLPNVGAGSAQAEALEDQPLNPDIEAAWQEKTGRKMPAAPGKGRTPADAGREKTSARDAARLAPRASEKKALTLDNLWITADETVDWTEALLSDTPRDGLTGQKLWNFYHRVAPRVLAGETEAYAEVLTTLNPLGDLTGFVSGMILRTPDADRVECVFECQQDDLDRRGRDYLGALSLRIARDLLAVLPVSEVGVTGNLDGKEKIQVTFRREMLLKQKMAFLQPADFAEKCGGKITL